MEHHAYVYEGALTELEALAQDAKVRFDVPEVSTERFESFGVDDARELYHLASLKNVAERTVYVVGVSGITTEAQQALLKLFEEPQVGVIFVLLLPHGTILPTLRSRCMPYPWQGEEASEVADAKAFLSSTYKERSAQIAELLKEEEGTRERVRTFVNTLEQLLYMKIGEGTAVRAGLADIAKVRSYLSDRSPSLKMLLEHLAATLPTVT